ncbi:hypothetical protein TNCV_2183951 [Trichonephila clavipes]|nr:hypothetical protein TNCV_2183951 [Trichonephila clavipes]
MVIWASSSEHIEIYGEYVMSDDMVMKLVRQFNDRQTDIMTKHGDVILGGIFSLTLCLLFGEPFHYPSPIGLPCPKPATQYLTDAGLVLGNPEPKPADPHSEMKENTFRRKERRLIDGTGDVPSVVSFYQNDGKVLTFYGIWKNDPAKPPAVRRLVLNVMQNPPPSGGWTTLMPAKADIAKGEVSSNMIIKRQKVLLDRRKEVGN